MNSRWSLMFHLISALKGYRHKFSGMPSFLNTVIEPVGMLGECCGSKRHEFGTLQAIIEPFVNGGIRCLTQDRSIAERTRPIFHGPVEPRHYFPLRHELSNFPFDVR